MFVQVQLDFQLELVFALCIDRAANLMESDLFSHLSLLQGIMQPIKLIVACLLFNSFPESPKSFIPAAGEIFSFFTEN